MNLSTKIVIAVVVAATGYFRGMLPAIGVAVMLGVLFLD